jgi:hypothetical protein
MRIVNEFTARLQALMGRPSSRGGSEAEDSRLSSRPAGGTAETGLGVIRQYGSHDPVLDAPRFIWRCACGEHPTLRFENTAKAQVISGDEDTGFQSSSYRETSASLPPDIVLAGSPYHVVRCSYCGRRSRPAPLPWEAITDWNRSNLALDMSLEHFPFFELTGLDARLARAKLMGIRTELETKRIHAKQRLPKGSDLGRRYRERIDAYLRWLVVAQALASGQARRSIRLAVPANSADRGGDNSGH